MFAPFPFAFDEPQGKRVDLESFEDFSREASKHSNLHGIAWRGQTDAKWRLRSSASVAEKDRIELYAEITGLGDYAKSILCIAQAVEDRLRDASRRVQKALGTEEHLRLLFRDELVDSNIHDDPVRYGELLSICQHFGMKTPLLDMTDSAYVALYFAAHGALGRSAEWRQSNKIAVWKVPANLWRREPDKPSFQYVMAPDLSSKELAMKQAQFEEIPSEELPRGFKRITISNIFPKIFRNDRLIAQQGSFVQVTPDFPLDHVIAMIGKYWEDDVFQPWESHLVQYTLPAHQALDCLIHLSKMNIRPETLFPDLVGQMESINLVLGRYDYAGVGDQLLKGSMFHTDGTRRHGLPGSST